MKDFFLEKSEIEQRIKGIQGLLAKNDMQGMLVSAESNVAYFSGYRNHAPWTTFTRPLFLFIPTSGTPLLYVQTFVAPEAEKISFVCKVRGFDSLLGPTPEELRGLMYELNIKNGKVAFELGFEQRIGFQVDVFLKLQEICKSETFVDGADIIWQQRIIKSEYEINCLQRAGDATTYVHDHIFNMIHKGMSERDISRLAQKLMLDGGAEYPGFVIITSGKGNYGRISKISSNRNLEDGDLLWLDLGAVYNGYWSDFCRCGVVGKISPERIELQKMVHEITMNVANKMKPGVAVAEIAQACADEMKKHGYDTSFDCGRMGHGMGLMSTEPPSVTIYDKTILQEGMVVNLEPGIVNEIGVFDLEENFVITKTGYKILSGGSREIHQIS